MRNSSKLMLAAGGVTAVMLAAALWPQPSPVPPMTFEERARYSAAQTPEIAGQVPTLHQDPDWPALASAAGVPLQVVLDELAAGDDPAEIEASLRNRAQFEAADALGMVPKWHSYHNPDGTMGRSPANPLAVALAADERGEATDEQRTLIAQAHAYANNR